MPARLSNVIAFRRRSFMDNSPLCVHELNISQKCPTGRMVDFFMGNLVCARTRALTIFLMMGNRHGLGTFNASYMLLIAAMVQLSFDRGLSEVSESSLRKSAITPELVGGNNVSILKQ